MTELVVDSSAHTLQIGNTVVSCAIGRGGAREAADKREGDGATPLGRWPIRAALLRPNRGLLPPEHLPWRWLREDDGWSDDPRDPAYNRPVRHPHGYSAERLWRDDGLYDAILLLGHNDDPPVAGMGSAIFLHLREGDTTEGCVAVPRETIAGLLARLRPGSFLMIR
ncbi:L,D-transpeptidase family protein [Sphingomonas sp. PR090111-T3T-6A]|uniref:L,D-transpeptidase family protein n=1 Tax=Sphingomonas sp. PR090111-T3T-6A TaxID=685778 RepID=UPI000363CE9B|nr:L,D-transpeptidase family protein [Sphingomonas sp. PR090111-T3T-6A]